MKLYMHPVSTTCRPISLLIAEKKLPIESEVIDLMTGAHFQAPYTAKNPNNMVPLLEDGDFRLTESSAILKYLADSFDLPEYPKDLKARARVNEIMDWFNSNFLRDYTYGMIYPQLFPHHKRPDEAAHAGTIAWGREKSLRWLGLLNDSWLGPDKAYLTGDQITIADYFASGIITAGEVVGCEFGQYPNICRWLGNMKKLSSWNAVHEVFDGWKSSVEKEQLVAVR